MTDSDKPKEAVQPSMESHSGGADPQTADLHHNQDTSVRSSGDQLPSEMTARDRDRLKTPGINPGS